ncbi:TetR/AcrR family transcriptional regulator [Streptomyces sp. NPDC047000]|uniref:TetR/AcrR family transcriptional regulator n=1 Tax=Streptomyces sp. NPDC047000 TaxID=3155474 RepID=UPI00340F7577
MPYGEGVNGRVRSEERRAEIVRAALEVIAERGYRGASLAAVAERVGLTQQGLMHHFPTKDALLVAVLDERDKWDAVPDSPWRLDLLAALVEYNAMRPGIVQTFSALLGESVTEDHPARAFFTERYERVRETMAETLRAEYGDRLPGGLTPERTAPLLVAVMDGLQYQWLLDPRGTDMAGAFRDFLVLLGESGGSVQGEEGAEGAEGGTEGEEGGHRVI